MEAEGQRSQTTEELCHAYDAPVPPVDREEFIRQLRPWRGFPASDNNNPNEPPDLHHQFATLPRLEPNDRSAPLLLPAILVGLAAMALGIPLIPRIYSAIAPSIFALTDDPTGLKAGSDLALLWLIWICCAGWILPFYCWDLMSCKFIDLWNETYREVYMTLCDTNMAVLISDQTMWESALGGLTQSTLAKVTGLHAPGSPAEAIRMAAVFWPWLRKLQSGDQRAVRSGALWAHATTLLAGERLGSLSGTTMIVLRARAAAMVDFILDPPEVLPATHNYLVTHERRLTARRFDHKVHGFDYRLREPEDRTDEFR